MFDFDAFRAERRTVEQEPLRVKVGGEIYDLPPSLPASVALDVLRARRDLGDDAQVPPDMVNDIGDSLFGEKAFRRLISTSGLSLDDLADLMVEVLRLYEGRGGIAGAVPNREARRKTPRSRSSTIGRSSRQISSGSTRSTSRKVSTR